MRGCSRRAPRSACARTPPLLAVVVVALLLLLSLALLARAAPSAQQQQQQQKQEHQLRHARGSAPLNVNVHAPSAREGLRRNHARAGGDPSRGSGGTPRVAGASGDPVRDAARLRAGRFERVLSKKEASLRSVVLPVRGEVPLAAAEGVQAARNAGPAPERLERPERRAEAAAEAPAVPAPSPDILEEAPMRARAVPEAEGDPALRRAGTIPTAGGDLYPTEFDPDGTCRSGADCTSCMELGRECIWCGSIEKCVDGQPKMLLTVVVPESCSDWYFKQCAVAGDSLGTNFSYAILLSIVICIVYVCICLGIAALWSIFCRE